MNVCLRPTREEDRLLIKNLFNLYQGDLSVYCDDFSWPDENGYFDPEATDGILPYGDGVFPYIILYDGHIAGFIMCTDASYALPGCAWRLEEIFIVRYARGKGIAEEAVRQLTCGRPGRWCLSVYNRNEPARRFWKKTIGRIVSETPGSDDMIDIVFDI